MRSYLQSLGANVWAVDERGYQYSGSIPLDDVGNKQYERITKEVNVIQGGLAQSEFIKVM